MSVHWDFGKISVSPKGALWTLSDFSSLPQISNTEIVSPYFTYENRTWMLFAYPKGHTCYSSFGWFGIIASYLTDTDELTVELGITNEHQEYIVSDRPIGDGIYRCPKLISSTDFASRKNELMPKGNLHILFRTVSEMEESTVHTVRNKTEDGKGSEEIPAYVESSTQTEEASGVWRLAQDFEKLLQNENITDVILKMHGQEFRAHRCILAARSPVFLAMMSHDTKEKNTGVVDIEDVNLEAIPDFLHYLYTGNVENLSSEKALKLYYVADKYQVIDLKQNCMDHLLTNISVANFCDVITLSLQHDEKHLKDACIDFFQEKSLDIVMTANWQTFLSENPIIGNELFIKHLELMKLILQETGKQIKDYKRR